MTTHSSNIVYIFMWPIFNIILVFARTSIFALLHRRS